MTTARVLRRTAEPLARILIYQMPDNSFFGYGIDAGVVAEAHTIADLVSQLNEVALVVRDAAIQARIPFNCTPDADDLRCWESRTDLTPEDRTGEPKSRFLMAGEMVLHKVWHGTGKTAKPRESINVVMSGAV